MEKFVTLFVAAMNDYIRRNVHCYTYGVLLLL
jgi:hypothetical protein